MDWEDYYETMGYDVLGGGHFQTVGAPAGFARAAPAAAPRGPVMPALRPAQFARPMMAAPVTYGAGAPTPALMPPRPAWRNELAPGVSYPGEGLQPLPLTPSLNNGVFTAAIQAITFTARPQAPFRAERLLTSVRRTGAAGVLILAQSLFVGRQLQLLQQGNFDIEFFSPTAFGVRLALDPAAPGIDIVMNCVTSPAVAGTDTVAVSMMLLGRSIR
jgi:hypothetical protein